MLKSSSFGMFGGKTSFAKAVNQKMDLFEIIQTILAALSLFATVGVSVMIYWLQKRHERETARKDAESKANAFLLENSEEIDFLPLCVICASVDRHSRHARKIYGKYLKCGREVQKEILKQAGYSIEPIAEGEEWVDRAIESFRADVKEYDLGRDFLYEGGKYLTKALDYRREAFVRKQQAKYRNCFGYPHISLEKGGLLTFDQYFDDYFYYRFRDDDKKKLSEEPKKPLDYLAEEENFGRANEDEVCYWIMVMVEEALANLRYFKKDRPFPEIGDAKPSTYEDKYYEVLEWLYSTYVKTK